MSRHDRKVRCPTCGKQVYPRGLGAHLRSHAKIEHQNNVAQDKPVDFKKEFVARELPAYLELVISDLRAIQHRTNDRLTFLSLTGVLEDLTKSVKMVAND